MKMALLQWFLWFCLCQVLLALAQHKSQKSLPTPATSVIDKISARNLRTVQEKNVQNAINSLFDYVVSEALMQLVDSNGIYHVPKVVSQYSVLGRNDGEFTAIDVTFEGLTTMERIEDVAFSNNNNHYTMVTTLRLSEAKVTVPAYQARRGYVNINGHIIMDIKGIFLTMTVSFDYNSYPCKIHLDDIWTHDAGDVETDITGLRWPLNKIMEPLYRKIIRNTAFEEAGKRVAEQGTQFHCAKYRPTLDLMKYSWKY